MSNYNPDTTAGRRGLIIKMLDDLGQVNVKELSLHFQVSEVTIRNDLAHLEQKNLLIRARGGAIKTDKASLDLRFLEKKSKNVREKEAIGRKAARFISDGDTIVVDSGTTTREIVNHLSRFSRLTVITNALNIASTLADMDNITAIMPGASCAITSCRWWAPLPSIISKNSLATSFFWPLMASM